MRTLEVSIYIVTRLHRYLSRLYHTIVTPIVLKENLH